MTSTTPGGNRSLNQQLLDAAKNGDNCEICRLLLLEDDEYGEWNIADVNTKDKRGYTVLHYCANRTVSQPDDGDTIRLILQRGALVEARNHEGCTPLHNASKNGLVDTASVLLETGGAHANVKNVFEWTPLMYCAEHNQSKVACLLLGKGASVHTKNRAGCTPLHYASMAGHVSIIYLLLGFGADIHARRKVDGKTPLELAKNEETLRVLTAGSSLSSVLLSSSSLPTQTAALEQQEQPQEKEKGGSSSLQAALPKPQQQQGGGGASSLQAALQQQTATASIITATTSKSSSTAGTIPGTTNVVMDNKRLEALVQKQEHLVQKQEHLAVSLQDQVNRLEMLLASGGGSTSSTINNDKDDTTITMLDCNGDFRQENSKTTTRTALVAATAPVKTITIQGSNKKDGIKPVTMHHRTQKHRTPQRQQYESTNDPATGRGYSMTIGSSNKQQQQQQPKQPSNDNSRVASIVHRHVNRAVLVPIGTNSDGGGTATITTTTTTENNNNNAATSRANSPDRRSTTIRCSSPRRLNDFMVPSRTPPTHHQQQNKTSIKHSCNFNKHNNNRHGSSTAGNNNDEYSPPSSFEDDDQKSRVSRSSLRERMKMYERDAAGHNNSKNVA